MRRASYLLALALLVPGPVPAGQPADEPAKKIEKLQEDLKKAHSLIAQLTREKNLLRDRAVAEEIKARALVDRLQRLESVVEAQTREIARLRAGRPAVPAKDPVPPKEKIEGTVTKVEEKSSLVGLSVGSDAGLAVGHTLEVFRLAPTPKYLGRIRIVQVLAGESVGKPEGRLLGPIQKGDKVGSQITPAP